MFRVHHSWQKIIDRALYSLDKEYLEFIKRDKGYFPNRDNFLNAFKNLPLEKTKYILFGQDPYPRKESAIGYAFIDGRVKNIFSENGLSKEVNRATSLRNFIKMLLVADKKLTFEDLSQKAISKIPKDNYINSIYQLKDNFEKKGVLLLNMALIFTSKEESKKNIKAFKPFIISLLNSILNRDIKLILFGNSAKELLKYQNISLFETLQFPHPYNHYFIEDKKAIEFFGNIYLLQREDKRLIIS